MFFKQTAPKDISLEQVNAAADKLGLNISGLTGDKVRAAFRIIVRSAHPDAGGDSAVAARRIEDAALARGLLLAWIESLPVDTCPACEGSGYVRSSALVVKPCTHC
jgi:DnaJ-class molecular chaperone